MTSHKFNLRFKFITGLVLFALALGLCITIIIYFHFNSIMKSEISQRSKLILAMSDAVQDYVKTELRPEMFKTLPKGRFVLKAMSSSYISNQIMARLNIEDTFRYHYRRVSQKPRNPDSKANTFEAGLIRIFNKNKKLKLWENDAKVGNRPYHLVARPVTYTDSCMQCHGDPDDAPRELIDLYGDTNGFHHLAGEVGGVVVAGFPIDMIKTPVMNVTLNYLGLYLLGIMLFAWLISLFFDRLVMKNLHGLTRIFKTQFSGDQEQSIIHNLSQKDEIEGLIEGVAELAICLSGARNELEDYALNLEKKVEERTLRLHTEAEKHLWEVQLFVSLLSNFSSSQNARQLICDVVERVGKRFDADQVVYHCLVSSEEHYAWKEDQTIVRLEKKIQDLLWKDEVLFENLNLYIPVKAPESHWGILCISWISLPKTQNFDLVFLSALGHQLAILIENIQAFSNMQFQNDMLQSIIEGISDPLLLIDNNCHIILANKGSKHILANTGRRNQEKKLKTFLCQGSSPRTDCDILDWITEKEIPINKEIKTPDNRCFAVDLYPLSRQEHLDLKIVVYARDITLEKQMIEKMQQTERLSAIGKMVAGIAHEINNPLGVIQCYTDLVKDAIDDSDTQNDIDVISKHTRTVQKIIQNLLNLSRPQKIITGKCSINTVVTNTLEVFKTQGASKNISISSNLEDRLPDIKCDATILEQILTNLWLNAFDSLDEQDGKIHISTHLSQNKQIILCIEDNGPGIPENIISHIFDPFYTTKEVGKGTGLGLSVIYGFINELGGDIEVQSDDTTRFYISFPCAGY
ncbi:c-type heme family protein [Desulfobacula sp.]